MPYFSQYDPNKVKDQGGTYGEHITGSDSNTNSTGNPDPNKAPQQSSGVSGSGFQNIDNYIKNNNTQGFANQVSGKVQSDVNNSNAALNDAQTGYKAKVDDSSKTPTASDFSTIIDNAGTDKAGANDAATYQGYTSQTYGGPASFWDDQSDASKFGAANQTALNNSQALTTGAGRHALLDSYFGNQKGGQPYTYGAKSLDNQFLQAGGIGQKAQELQSQAQATQGQALNSAGSLGDYATQANKRVQDSAAAARAAIGVDDKGNVITGDGAGALGSAWKAVDDAVAAGNAGVGQTQTSIARDLASGVISQEEADSLGLHNGDQLYGVNLGSPGVQTNAGAPLTAANVMTPEQQARIKALDALAGGNVGSGDKYANTTLAAPAAATTLNQARAQQLISAAKSSYDQDVAHELASIGVDVRNGGDPASLQGHIDAIAGDINTLRNNPSYNTNPQFKDAVDRNIATKNDELTRWKMVQQNLATIAKKYNIGSPGISVRPAVSGQKTPETYARAPSAGSL